jgi:hypothetical protein
MLSRWQYQNNTNVAEKRRWYAFNVFRVAIGIDCGNQDLAFALDGSPL